MIKDLLTQQLIYNFYMYKTVTQLMFNTESFDSIIDFTLHEPNNVKKKQLSN